MNTTITVQEYIFAVQYMTAAAFVDGLTFMVRIVLPSKHGISATIEPEIPALRREH